MAKARQQEYGNTSIVALKDEERVRKRPAVIFGSDGIEGCQHSVFEIISNSLSNIGQVQHCIPPFIKESVMFCIFLFFTCDLFCCINNIFNCFWCCFYFVPKDPRIFCNFVIKIWFCSLGIHFQSFACHIKYTLHQKEC